ncbi:MAG: ribonuclease III [Dehalococcoidales bacterium]|nr:ribonuclease III [Dehalococcoidales bacterium]
MPAPEDLQKTSGIAFKNQLLLQQALSHSSYCHEYPDLAPQSNERLEFLGDAVLGLIVAEKLYLDYPALDEGSMTKLRSALVREDTLARVAKALNLGEYLCLGRGEEAGGGRSRPANLARALEAFIASIYLDRGLASAREFVLKWFYTELKEAVDRGTEVNYKSWLQELVQSRGKSSPIYRVVATTGPDHDRIFTVEVLVDGRVAGTGSGKSKKAAESGAAQQALVNLGEDFTS